jgi:hypothetical protein
MHECGGDPYGADRPHRGAVAWRSSARVLVPRTSSDRTKRRMVALRASVVYDECHVDFRNILFCKILWRNPSAYRSI